MADTFLGRLKRMKWRFAESRMQNEWNELYAFALSTTASTIPGTIGALDYDTHVTLVPPAYGQAAALGTGTLFPRVDVEDSGDLTDATNIHRRVDAGNSGYQTRNSPRGGFIA